MSLGFGFGLPHYVAVLGGGGPPATVYFLSLTTPTTGSLYPNAPPLVDGSGNIAIFGLNSTGGMAVKLTSSGALSISKSFAPTGTGFAVPDGSGGYYASLDAILPYCCCGCNYYPYPSILKLDSSFNILAEIRTDSTGDTTVSSNPVLDTSGNIFNAIFDYSLGYSGAGYLFKINPALNSANYYRYNSGFTFLRNIRSPAITTTNQLITAGAYYVAGCCCIYSAYATISSIPVATPTATPTWQVWDSAAAVGDFNTLALDSSNNVYAGLYYYNAVSTNTLVKISSAGAVQWQYQYTGMLNINNIATDASGNVYCAALNSTGSLVIIKVNSSGVLQYSRTLTAATLSINGIPNISISGSIMYITAAYLGKLLVFKVPTDGSLTQSISVGGSSFTYAAGAVTSSATTVALASTTVPPALVSTSAPLTTTPITASSLTPTTAVTVL